jgi:hypothetical protein
VRRCERERDFPSGVLVSGLGFCGAGKSLALGPSQRESVREAREIDGRGPDGCKGEGRC